MLTGFYVQALSTWPDIVYQDIYLIWHLTKIFPSSLPSTISTTLNPINLTDLVDSMSQMRCKAYGFWNNNDTKA